MTNPTTPQKSVDNDPNGVRYLPIIIGVFALLCIFAIYLSFRIFNPIFEKMENSALPLSMHEVRPESKEATFIKDNDSEIIFGVVTACGKTPSGSNISQTFYDSESGTYVNYIVPEYDVRHEIGLYRVVFDPEWFDPYIFNYGTNSNQVDPDVRKELIPQALQEHDGIKHYRVDWRIVTIGDDKLSPADFNCTIVR